MHVLQSIILHGVLLIKNKDQIRLTDTNTFVFWSCMKVLYAPRKYEMYNYESTVPNRQKTLNQCWINVGPMLKNVDQY